MNHVSHKNKFEDVQLVTPPAHLWSGGARNTLLSDIKFVQSGDTLRLRLIHKDAANIPRNHIRQAGHPDVNLSFKLSPLITFLSCRYVCWSAQILKSHHKLKSALGLGLQECISASSSRLE